ncbi:MAG TPA: carbohydrate kinase [Chromatiales bacterium]|nr:carbohydrate kinase [Thiotrichales bacterium]HIP68376.1 carbohydrate kinase [Chromatiales bacterium]
MARILVTGIAARDIIHTVSHYPAEDEEMRAESQEIRLGGNAANTATVLAQHSHDVHFLGTVASDSAGKALIREMQNNNIHTQHCPRMTGSTPTSYITLNQENGSRTIIHYRDLPEFSAPDFPMDAISTFDWFHFEGRNVAETRKMLEAIRSQKVDQSISLEVEKCHENIESLFELADVLLFSRDYARFQQFDNAAAFLKSTRRQFNNKILICSWGEAGATGMDRDRHIIQQAAWKPPRVIDTIAAGDTFNAGIIHSFSSGKTLVEALSYACELAGRKVGQSGLKNLAKS